MVEAHLPEERSVLGRANLRHINTLNILVWNYSSSADSVDHLVTDSTFVCIEQEENVIFWQINPR